MQIIEYQNKSDLCAGVADISAAHLAKRLQSEAPASLVVSGGRTPRSYLPALFQREVDWPRVTVTLSDERWVAPSHADSNEGLVRSCLPDGPAIHPMIVPLYGGEKTPLLGLAAAEERLSKIPRPFDLALMGMGEDGHVASLFPNSPATPGEMGLCVAVENAPLFPRISLSAPVLEQIRTVLLIVTGQSKRDVLSRAMRPAALPVSILIANPGLTVLYSPH